MDRRLTAMVIAACVIAIGAVAYLTTGNHHDTAADVRADTAATPTSSAATTTGSPSAPVPSSTASQTPAPTSATSSPSTPTPSRTPSKTPSPTKTTGSSSAPAPAQGAPPAGRIRPGASYSGVATAYDSGDGTGACLFDPTSDPMIAAMNVADYETAKACGASILIHAANGKSITVRIVNECPAPCAPGQIDLSQAAFAKLADLKVGRLPITWSLQSPGTADTISIRYKTGSSQWWCGIQVIGHRNPVGSLEVRVGGAWRSLGRTGYNYFISADGGGCGGQIRVTDIYGQQLVIDAMPVTPNVAQRTKVQFTQH